MPLFVFALYLGHLSGVLLALGLTLLVYWYTKTRISQHVFPGDSAYNWKLVVLACAFSFATCILSGVFSELWGSQTSDWIKHNTMLRELVNSPRWPVVYELKDSPFGPDSAVTVVYYLGAYLIPAAFGRLVHSFPFSECLFEIWIFLGIAIGFTALLVHLGRLTRTRFTVSGATLALLAVLVLGGWDWGLHLIDWLPKGPLRAIWLSQSHILETQVPCQYPAFVTSVQFVPQHLIPSLIGVPIALASSVDTSLVFCILCLVWSPFAALGVLTVLASRLLGNLNELRRLEVSRVRRFAPALLGMVAIVGVMAFYYGLRAQADYRPVPIFPDYLSYFAFMGFKIVLPFALCSVLFWKNLKNRTTVVVLIVFLLLFPIYRMGTVGLDMIARATIAPMLALSAVTLGQLLFWYAELPVTRVTLSLVLLAGSLPVPVRQVQLDLLSRGRQGSEGSVVDFRPNSFRDQYLGKAPVSWVR